MKETLRMFSTAALLIRTPKRDIDVAGTRIPEGATVWLATEAVHPESAPLPGTGRLPAGALRPARRGADTTAPVRVSSVRVGLGVVYDRVGYTLGILYVSGCDEGGSTA